MLKLLLLADNWQESYKECSVIWSKLWALMKSMKLRLTSLEKEKCTSVNSLKSTEKSSNKLNLKEKGLLLKKNNLSNIIPWLGCSLNYALLSSSSKSYLSKSVSWVKFSMLILFLLRWWMISKSSFEESILMLKSDKNYCQLIALFFVCLACKYDCNT